MAKPDPNVISSRPNPLILVFLIVFILAGCIPQEFSLLEPSTNPAPTGTKVILPVTWTLLPPTPSITASIIPSNTPTPTITPTQTATLTQTPSVTPNLTTLEPSPTTDWSVARLPDCTFTASEPGVRLLSAPFIDPYRVLPTMEPGKPYPAVITKPTYSLLLENGEPLGWIDYRLIAVSLDGDDCLTEYDDREVWDFPLCFFTPLGDIFGYADSEFMEPRHDLTTSTTLVVLHQSETSIFTAYGSSGPSLIVKRDEVYTHGNCENIPTLAKAITETSLYNDIPGQGGEVVYTLAVDESIFLQSQQKNGSPPPGAQGTGYWIYARRHSWAEDINGWVWSGHVEMK